MAKNYDYWFDIYYKALSYFDRADQLPSLEEWESPTEFDLDNARSIWQDLRAEQKDAGIEMPTVREVAKMYEQTPMIDLGQIEVDNFINFINTTAMDCKSKWKHFSVDDQAGEIISIITELRMVYTNDTIADTLNNIPEFDYLRNVLQMTPSDAYTLWETCVAQLRAIANEMLKQLK